MWPSPYLDAFGEEVSPLKRFLIHCNTVISGSSVHANLLQLVRTCNRDCLLVRQLCNRISNCGEESLYI